MATLQDYAAELVGMVPRLDILKARQLINRAWREIRDARPWSFLLSETAILIPEMIQVGTVATTQFSNQVIASGTSKTALDAVGMDIPLATRQFRVSGGPLYNITAYNSGTGAITLDRNYGEGTVAASAYQIYKCFYETPADFKRWVSIMDPINSFQLRLNIMKEEIDRRDPQRTSQGQAYYVSSYKTKIVGSDTVPVYELWPSPTIEQSLIGLYLKRGEDLSATVSLPNQISPELLIQKALEFACQWAMINAGLHIELTGVDWKYISNMAMLKYKELLQQAKVTDDDIFLQQYVLANGQGVYPPVDAKFMQSHDVSWG